ncbi:hypothetical protein Taro_025836 [Colocasia esculenta]|uniref:Uncharacterized protein n=1 Tax=Colocasia esculenta TaxID=4460 RepID=A0A843VAD9_COLES|nr:hypothetical protein [Colocasia esculenta]
MLMELGQMMEEERQWYHEIEQYCKDGTFPEEAEAEDRRAIHRVELSVVNQMTSIMLHKKNRATFKSNRVQVNVTLTLSASSISASSALLNALASRSSRSDWEVFAAARDEDAPAYVILTIANSVRCTYNTCQFLNKAIVQPSPHTSWQKTAGTHHQTRRLTRLVGLGAPSLQSAPVSSVVESLEAPAGPRGLASARELHSALTEAEGPLSQMQVEW